MRFADKNYIINTVFKTNILPVTSECNTSCIFCSNKQNPEDIEIFCLPKLSMDDFMEISSFLSPHKKIIIGEAASRIIEGEPLLYRNFTDVVAIVRQKYKVTPVQITTNATLLNRDIVKQLDELGNIELNISLNCIHPSKRKQILGLKRDGDIREKMYLIKDRLKFSGSCVLVPGLLQWEDVEEIIALLDCCNGEVAKIYLPGHTAKSETYVDLARIFSEACDFVERVKRKYSIPIIVEPSFICDLECSIAGVIRNTPADTAGLRQGDVICGVNGESVRTRVEAFNKAYSLPNPQITILRGGREIFTRLSKKKNSSPGFILLYDIDPRVMDEINTAVKRHNARSVLFMTSELAAGILRPLFAGGGFEFEYDIVSVSNEVFGGNIKCAGLLTLQDVFKSASGYLAGNKRPDLILLPPVMFDYTKRDLMGKSIKELEDRLGIPVDTLTC